MEEILEKLFDFLRKNRNYNKRLQERYYKSIILPYDSIPDKIISLLYHIANTQSQPRIDYLANFYKNIYKHRYQLESFDRFLGILLPTTSKNFNGLFQSLRCQPGWGNKTSALFAKSIFHLHNNAYPKQLRIWNDVPNKINENDQFYLPVDTVITSIFKRLDSKTNWNFINTNKLLKHYYHGNDIEIWDDLWFWGFITQNGSGVNRVFAWNENKYWTLKESDKNSEAIIKIKTKAEEFLDLLNVGTIKMKRTTIPKAKK
ncbi:MAG: hypothetical protein U9R42_06545 [Bacteroidota bacterium]|nr:hypothetical protein [Bacteroidota bacterium]